VSRVGVIKRTSFARGPVALGDRGDSGKSLSRSGSCASEIEWETHNRKMKLANRVEIFIQKLKLASHSRTFFEWLLILKILSEVVFCEKGKRWRTDGGQQINRGA